MKEKTRKGLFFCFFTDLYYNGITNNNYRVMAADNITSSNIQPWSKEGLLISTQSIAAQVQAQVDYLLPKKIATDEQNIFWYTLSKVWDLLHLNPSNSERFSTIIDAMGTLRQQANTIIPEVIEEQKKPSETNILPFQTKPVDSQELKKAA